MLANWVFTMITTRIKPDLEFPQRLSFLELKCHHKGDPMSAMSLRVCRKECLPIQSALGLRKPLESKINEEFALMPICCHAHQ